MSYHRDKLSVGLADESCGWPESESRRKFEDGWVVESLILLRVIIGR